MATVFATVTTPGPPGPTGPPGYSPVYIVAAGPPSSGVGSDHDMYINSLTGDVYGPKIGGVWGPIVCNIKGPTGATGATGATGYSPQYIVAAGPPAGGQGNNGDMYINSTTSDVYGPKASGAWGGIVCNIKGIQGPPGVAYTPMGAWVSTTTYAQGHEVTYNNQLYISLQSTNLNNVPATSPTWWQLVGSGASQTPWLSDIDGATHNLYSVGKIGIGLNPPTTLLHAKGPNTPGILVENTSGTVAVELKDSAATPNRWWLASGLVAATDGRFGIYDARQGIARLAIDPAGNVGIGTTSPQRTLHVVGPNNSPIISIGNDNNVGYSLGISYLSGGFGCIQALGNGLGAMLQLNPAGGNVGIGTVSPSTTVHVATHSVGSLGQLTLQDLDVASTGSPACAVTGVASDGTRMMFLGYPGGGFGKDLLVWNDRLGAVRLGTNGTERVRIDTVGNVGIGLAAPTANLHVWGFGQQASNPSTSTGLGATLYLQDNGGGAGNGGMVMFGFSQGAWASIKGFAQNGGGNTVGDLGFAVRRGTTDPTLTEAMRIQYNGNVGIGTASPGGALEVSVFQKWAIFSSNVGSVLPPSQSGVFLGQNLSGGAGEANIGFQGGGSGLSISDMTGGTNKPRLQIDSGGNVSVGNGVNFTFGPASDSGVVFFGGTAITRRASDGSLLITGTQGVIAITSASNTYILGGNVGIGTQSPDKKLTITPASTPATAATAVQISICEQGSNPAYRLELGYFLDSGSAYKAVIQATQNGPASGYLLLNPSGGVVGIGKLSPTFALDITGDCNVTGAFRVGGVAIGAGGVGVQINSSASLGIYQYLNFFAMSGINITGGGPGGPGNNTYTIQFGTSSDLQLKRNVQTLSGGLAIINQLRPITAEWNGLAGMREGQRLISIIAQDLREVIPDAVEAYRTKLRPEDSEETELLAYDPMAITSHLILAVQQLLRRLETLEQKVN